MKKRVKTSMIALSLVFAVLLTACSTNNSENETIGTPENSTATKAENGTTTVSDNTSEESQSSISETYSDTTASTNSEVSVSENVSEIQLNVIYPEPAPEGAEKGGAFPFEYNGTEYVWGSPVIGEYIIDKDKNVFDLITGDSELDLEYTVNSAMMELKNLDYLGKVGETYLGALGFDEADLYRYGDKLLLVYNSVRYDIMFFQDFYNVEFTAEEKVQWAEGTIGLDKALADHGVEYDPSIFFCAVLYEPREE